MHLGSVCPTFNKPSLKSALSAQPRLQRAIGTFRLMADIVKAPAHINRHMASDADSFDHDHDQVVT